MITPWIRLAVRDDVVAEFALRRFDSSVRFAGRDADLILRFLRVDRSLWDLFDGLVQDPQGLANLVDADEVVVHQVAVVAHRHVEVEAVVDPVGGGAADVVGHPSRAQDRTRDRVGDGVLRVDHPHALHAREQHFVLGQHAVEFVGLVLQAVVNQVFDLLHHVVGDVSHHAAEAEVVAHHARAGDGFEDVEDEFAFLEGIQRGRVHRAEVVEQCADEDEVVLNAAQLGDDHADVFGAFGDGDLHQFFDGEGVAEVVGHRVEVIEAVGEWHVQQECVAFADLVVVAMQIAQHGFEPGDRFAVEGHHCAEDAVRGGVVRSHVDDDTVGVESVLLFHRVTRQRAVEQRVAFGNPFFGVEVLREGEVILERIFILRHVELPIGPTAFERLGIFLVEALFPIFAKRVTFESFPHQNAAQVGVTGEFDPEQIPCFALLQIYAGIEVDQ